MNYLLDTNTCIAIINGRPESVRLRLQKAVEAQANVWVPAIQAVVEASDEIKRQITRSICSGHFL